VHIITPGFTTQLFELQAAQGNASERFLNFNQKSDGFLVMGTMMLQ